MATDRIPNLLAHALLTFDGRFPADCEEENGCANVGTGSKGEDSGTQDSSFSLATQINGAQGPVRFGYNSLWKDPSFHNPKNPKADAKAAEGGLGNEDSKDSLEGLRRGFRFFLPHPQPRHHFDI